MGLPQRAWGQRTRDAMAASHQGLARDNWMRIIGVVMPSRAVQNLVTARFSRISDGLEGMFTAKAEPTCIAIWPSRHLAIRPVRWHLPAIFNATVTCAR